MSGPSAADDLGSPAESRPGEEPVRRGRGRPRDPDTDRRITAAAARLLLERGFDHTTVEDVAAIAGVGKATVYRRWSSKEELALTAIETLFGSEIPEPDTGSIVTDLAENYRQVLTFVNKPEGAAYLRMSIAESVRDDRVAALYRASIERREAQARVTFEKAIERGEVRADIDLASAVQWLGGLLVNRAVSHRPLPSVAETDTLVDFALRGVLSQD